MSDNDFLTFVKIEEPLNKRKYFHVFIFQFSKLNY